MLRPLTRNVLILSGGRGLRLWLRRVNRLAGAPSADSGSPLATDERSRRGFSDLSRLQRPVLLPPTLCSCLTGWRWPGRHGDAVGWTGEDRYANSSLLARASSPLQPASPGTHMPYGMTYGMSPLPHCSSRFSDPGRV